VIINDCLSFQAIVFGGAFVSVEVRSAVQAEREDRKQKRIIVTLFVIGFIGLGYAAYDYLTLIDRAVLPQNLSEVDPVIEQWKSSGLVYSFDASKSTIVVNESEWAGKKRTEKIGIITQLARYCAEKNSTTTWALTVKGRSTSATLGEMGQRGILVN